MKKKLFLLLGGVVATVLSMPCSAQVCSTPSFTAATNFEVGDGPRSVTTGDFNGDGKLDLAVANSYFRSSNVSVLLGNGSGGFGAATNFAAGDGPYSVTTGDFNGDGKLDLAVANWYSSSGEVCVVMENSSGGLA